MKSGKKIIDLMVSIGFAQQKSSNQLIIYDYHPSYLSDTYYSFVFNKSMSDFDDCRLYLIDNNHGIIENALFMISTATEENRCNILNQINQIFKEEIRTMKINEILS